MICRGGQQAKPNRLSAVEADSLDPDWLLERALAKHRAASRLEFCEDGLCAAHLKLAWGLDRKVGDNAILHNHGVAI